jgi:hypothetical protein
MPEREFKLPEVAVQSSLDAFINSAGVAAGELVKILRVQTVLDPERGKEVPGRPSVRMVAKRFPFADEEIICQVHYQFDERAVKWLLFKWQRNPK